MQKLTAQQRIENLQDAMADDIMNMTDDEILAEAKPGDAEEVKQIIDDVLTEHAQIRLFTRLERAYLARRECAMCGLKLDYAGCASIYERCSTQTRIDRRKRCLRNYRPRKRKT